MQCQVKKEETKKGAWSPGPAGLWLSGSPIFSSWVQATGFLSAQAEPKSIHVSLGQTPHSPWSGYFCSLLAKWSDLPLQNCLNLNVAVHLGIQSETASAHCRGLSESAHHRGCDQEVPQPL